MRKFPVGQIQLAVLDDGCFPFPAALFFHNVPEAVWRTQLETDAQGKIPVGHNYGLVDTGREVIVIDTGYGEDTHDGRTGHLLEELERAGYRREQVGIVILTHAHGDHIKRNTLLQSGKRIPTFPHARYHLARADHDWFGGPGHVQEFDEQIVPLEELGLLVLFDGQTQLAPGILLLPTPGHTPGHASVLIESQGQSVLFLGDVCHHPLHFAHPEWVSAFDTHPALTPQTRARLFSLALERDALLVCPHALAPGLGRLQRDGGSYRWQTLH
ncbi:MBL fold metallo-hydrolase [Noviherbaspirillum massiliense]|uniref:MBL fold metallo-hydrolase n=1 Tax=Noviherbaspirillum massiliense TaxID=1465823 RepID=UPI0003170D50|nr:MBL fold metallo-hydrolase [Noviherbaspirillum massiliense]